MSPRESKGARSELRLVLGWLEHEAARMDANVAATRELIRLRPDLADVGERMAAEQEAMAHAFRVVARNLERGAHRGSES